MDLLRTTNLDQKNKKDWSAWMHPHAFEGKIGFLGHTVCGEGKGVLRSTF